MSSLEFLVWLEQFRSAFTNALFIGASALGSEEAYLAILTIIYLCVDHRFGFRLLLMFLVSAYCNAQLKAAFDTPRPFVAYPDEVHPLYVASGQGGSFPSGHSQSAAVVWGLIASRQRSWALRGAILALIALIAFSRLYCQVHWPADVVGGLSIGLLLLIVYWGVCRAWAAGSMRLGRGHWAAAVVAAAALMYLLGYEEESCVSASGALLGAGLGYVLLEGRGYEARASFAAQVLKVLVALAALFAIQLGGGRLPIEAPWARALRYGLIGFTAAYLLPLLFMHVQRRCGCPRASETVAGRTEDSP
jgi:membrane-associated phospholipid phosphatase